MPFIFARSARTARRLSRADRYKTDYDTAGGNCECLDAVNHIADLVRKRRCPDFLRSLSSFVPGRSFVSFLSVRLPDRSMDRSGNFILSARRVRASRTFFPAAETCSPLDVSTCVSCLPRPPPPPSPQPSPHRRRCGCQRESPVCQCFPI